jgi:uncharacterized protein DUF6502
MRSKRDVMLSCKACRVSALETQRKAITRCESRSQSQSRDQFKLAERPDGTDRKELNMQRIDDLLRQAELDIQRAVVAMFVLKLESGTTPQQLKAFVEVCVTKATKAYRPKKSGEIVWLYQIARVLRTWHLETRFITSEGEPKPLKMDGKNSLRSLVRCHFPSQTVNLVLGTMKRNGLLRRRRSGHWVPTSKYARTPKPTVELLSHFAEGMSRFAETVGKNTTSVGAKNLLLERAAQVSDLPLSEANAFRRYVHTQGMAYLTTIDDWLESRSRNRKKPTAVCNAGVFTFAFIDDQRNSTSILPPTS